MKRYKCICPKCHNEFFHSNKELILHYIKKNPGCSLTDVHWDIRMSLPSVLRNCEELNKDNKIIIKRPKEEKGHGRVQLYTKEINNATNN